MGLLLWLIILLAIAWGVADFQLQSRIEREPPPVPVTKPAPVVPPKTDDAPPVEETPGSNPPAGSAAPAPDAERAVTTQDTQALPPVTERTPQ